VPAPLRWVLLFLGRALRDYGYVHVCPPPLVPPPGAPPAPGHPEKVVPLPDHERRWWQDLETRLAGGGPADRP
jgi:hypothetical protein